MNRVEGLEESGKRRGREMGMGGVCQDQGRRKRLWPVTPKPLISLFAPRFCVAALTMRICIVNPYFTRIGVSFFGSFSDFLFFHFCPTVKFVQFVQFGLVLGYVYCWRCDTRCTVVVGTSYGKLGFFLEARSTNGPCIQMSG
jgi:hypothetical protein